MWRVLSGPIARFTDEYGRHSGSLRDRSGGRHIGSGRGYPVMAYRRECSPRVPVSGADADHDADPWECLDHLERGRSSLRRLNGRRMFSSIRRINVGAESFTSCLNDAEPQEPGDMVYLVTFCPDGSPGELTDIRVPAGICVTCWPVGTDPHSEGFVTYTHLFRGLST